MYTEEYSTVPKNVNDCFGTFLHNPLEKQYGSGPRRRPRCRPGGDAFDELESENGIVFDRRGDLVKFLAVAETGGILAAAERLAITQPALSRLIARLEAGLDGPLFERQVASGADPAYERALARAMPTLTLFVAP